MAYKQYKGDKPSTFKKTPYKFIKKLARAATGGVGSLLGIGGGGNTTNVDAASGAPISGEFGPIDA